jgi:hypothetical protein
LRGRSFSDGDDDAPIYEIREIFRDDFGRPFLLFFLSLATATRTFLFCFLKDGRRLFVACAGLVPLHAEQAVTTSPLKRSPKQETSWGLISQAQRVQRLPFSLAIPAADP